MSHLSSTISNYTSKDQYFRNERETTMTRKERARKHAQRDMDKSLHTAGLFFNVLVTEALEKHAKGQIAKSTSVESVARWAREVAEDKRAHLMARDRFEYDSLEYLQEGIRAAEHPNGFTWVRDRDGGDRDLRQTSRQAKQRSGNTGLVDTEKFHLMHDDVPPRPVKDAVDLCSDRSTPTSITESATSSTSSIKEPSDALKATVDEAYLQLGVLSGSVQSNEQSDNRIDLLEEVISRLTEAEKLDPLLIGTNEAMAKNNHAVKIRLDSLIGIVARKMKNRAGTI